MNWGLSQYDIMASSSVLSPLSLSNSSIWLNSEKIEYITVSTGTFLADLQKKTLFLTRNIYLKLILHKLGKTVIRSYLLINDGKGF